MPWKQKLEQHQQQICQNQSMPFCCRKFTLIHFNPNWELLENVVGWLVGWMEELRDFYGSSWMMTQARRIWKKGEANIKILDDFISVNAMTRFPLTFKLCCRGAYLEIRPPSVSSWISVTELSTLSALLSAVALLKLPTISSALISSAIAISVVVS